MIGVKSIGGSRLTLNAIIHRAIKSICYFKRITIAPHYLEKSFSFDSWKEIFRLYFARSAVFSSDCTKLLDACWCVRANTCFIYMSWFKNQLMRVLSVIFLNFFLRWQRLYVLNSKTIKLIKSNWNNIRVWGIRKKCDWQCLKFCLRCRRRLQGQKVHVFITGLWCKDYFDLF